MRTAGDCASAEAAIAADAFDVVVTDWRLPDGQAMRFVVDCPFPVVAVSGHPEEVEQHAVVRAVLAKPVTPSRLLEALETARGEVGPAGPPVALPIDVRAVLAAAEACLPAGTVATLHDDGTFVVWRADVAADMSLEGLTMLGGDLRITDTDAARRIELRLCRDGRPHTGIPTAAPDGEWPGSAELAVDFHGTEPSPAAFAACLERVRQRATRGHRVHLLNIPESLRATASDWEKANDMPMKEPVGPRLPAVLVDLWSQP